MDEVLNMIKNFIDGKTDPDEFSVILPDVLIQKYDEMLEENKQATDILNENLPDICAEYEPGMDADYFRKAVQKEYEAALKAA